MLTKAGEGGKPNADHCWQGGRRGPGTPDFGWRYMWAAPYSEFMLQSGSSDSQMVLVGHEVTRTAHLTWHCHQPISNLPTTLCAAQMISEHDVRSTDVCKTGVDSVPLPRLRRDRRCVRKWLSASDNFRPQRLLSWCYTFCFYAHIYMCNIHVWYTGSSIKTQT